jgi:uncharacterized protein (TIGR00369 family)
MGARTDGTLLPIESTFIGFLAPTFHDEGEGTLSCTVMVRDELKQPMGIVHGGIYCAIAETLASMGAAREVGIAGPRDTPPATVVMGQQNNTTFIRPVTGGHVRGVAKCRHKGRTTQVWQIEMFDADERLCAVAQVTMAVRPART